MPPMEQQSRTTKVVYWASAGFDNYGEYKITEDAIQLVVRWNAVKSEAKDAKGKTISIVVEIIADRQLEIGSIIWVGRLLSLPDPLSGIANLYQLMTVDITTSVCGKFTYYGYGLAKFSNSLPSFNS